MNKQQDIQEVTLLHVVSKFIYENLYIKFFILLVIILLFIASYDYLGDFIYFKFAFVGILILAVNMFFKQQTKDYYNAKFRIYGIVDNYSYKASYKKINFKYKKKKVEFTEYKFKTNMIENDLNKEIAKFKLMFGEKIKMNYDKGKLYIKTYN